MPAKAEGSKLLVMVKLVMSFLDFGEGGGISGTGVKGSGKGKWGLKVMKSWPLMMIVRMGWL